MSELTSAVAPASNRLRPEPRPQLQPRCEVRELGGWWGLVKVEVEPALLMRCSAGQRPRALSSASAAALTAPAVLQAWDGVAGLARQVDVYPDPERPARLVFAFLGLVDPDLLLDAAGPATRFLEAVREAITDRRRANAMVASSYRTPALDDRLEQAAIVADDSAARLALQRHRASLTRPMMVLLGVIATLLAAWGVLVGLGA